MPWLHELGPKQISLDCLWLELGSTGIRLLPNAERLTPDA